MRKHRKRRHAFKLQQLRRDLRPRDLCAPGGGKRCVARDAREVDCETLDTLAKQRGSPLLPVHHQDDDAYAELVAAATKALADAEAAKAQAQLPVGLGVPCPLRPAPAPSGAARAATDQKRVPEAVAQVLRAPRGGLRPLEEPVGRGWCRLAHVSSFN